jgi:HlyD family secretion protein
VEDPRRASRRRVFDTFYREGEYVPAGKAAALALLPPGNVKIRFFVERTPGGRAQTGDEAL